MFRPRLVATVLLALLAVSWGAIPLIVREDIPASHLVAMRLWLGGMALVTVMAGLGRLRLPGHSRGRLVASGLLLAVHWALFFATLKTTTVAVALSLLYLGPLGAAVLAGPLYAERVGPRTKTGLGLAFIGVLAVARPGSGATTAGVLLGLAAAGTLTALMLVAKPAAERLGGLVVAAFELVVASIVTTPWMIEAVRKSSGFWTEFLILGVLLTGLAGVIYWTAMRHLPVALVSVLMYLEPASAVVWAAAFLSEPAELFSWLGVGLVIGGGTLAATEADLKEPSRAIASV